MTLDGVSQNKSIYQGLMLKPQTVVVSDNTRVVTSNPLQSFNSSASLIRNGNANPSLNFHDASTQSSANISAGSATNVRSAQQIIGSLTASKNNPTKFAAAVNKILQNTDERSVLIKHFGLDSPANKKNLGIAMFLEAGQGINKQHMLPVGAVILNRALSNNLGLAASGKAQRVNISDIVREKSQFAIKSSYNSALNGGRESAVNNGTSSEVQSMVNSLCKGQVGDNASAKNAFFFQRATLRHQSFKAGSHSFSQTPSSTQYINGNYLVGAGNRGYYHK